MIFETQDHTINVEFTVIPKPKDRRVAGNSCDQERLTTPDAARELPSTAQHLWFVCWVLNTNDHFTTGRLRRGKPTQKVKDSNAYHLVTHLPRMSLKNTHWHVTSK